MNKRLYKSNKNKVLEGGCGILAYIIAAVVIPRNPE